jgi:hypothetical protein
VSTDSLKAAKTLLVSFFSFGTIQLNSKELYWLGKTQANIVQWEMQTQEGE